MTKKFIISITFIDTLRRNWLKINIYVFVISYIFERKVINRRLHPIFEFTNVLR